METLYTTEEVAAALLALHRSAGASWEEVWLDGTALAFRDAGARTFYGDVEDWHIRDVTYDGTADGARG